MLIKYMTACEKKIITIQYTNLEWKERAALAARPCNPRQRAMGHFNGNLLSLNGRHPSSGTSAMSKVKDKILESAKRLFIEKGYDAISLRAIAEQAGTTIGNLTYHYPQKEDLIAAIQKDSQENFIAELQDIPEQPEAIVRYICFLAKRTQEAHVENSFYFKNMIELCGKYVTVRENILIFREKIYHVYLECFDRLRRSNIMRMDIPIKNYNNLAYVIVVLVTVWTQNASPYYDHNLPHTSLSEAILDLIHPCLTSSGREMLRHVGESGAGQR